VDQVLPILLPLLFFGGFFGFFVWMVLNLRSHLDPEGPMKRGVPVWKSEVPADQLQQLSKLPGGTHEFEWGWARVQGGWLLVRADFNHPLLRADGLRRKTSWPYLLRIDLRSGAMTWRVPTGTFVFTVPHLLGMFPFVALLYYFNHRLQKAPSLRALELLAEWTPRQDAPATLSTQTDELVLL